MASRKAHVVVYRVGSNACNQERTPRMPVAVFSVTGRSAGERAALATRAARELPFAVTGCYSNQYLETREVRPWSSAAAWADYDNAIEHQQAYGIIL